MTTPDTNAGAGVGVDPIPTWALASPQLLHYYCHEWGVPVHDERGVFERLSLEVYQSGLSWATILRKRDAFRQAFCGFDVQTVANFTERDVDRLCNDAGIVRNRRKTAATVANAQATLELREATPLPQLVWEFAPSQRLRATTESEVPTLSEESHALTAVLRQAGFSYVGPTNLYALFCAIGPVNAHPASSRRYAEIERMQLEVLAQMRGSSSVR